MYRISVSQFGNVLFSPMPNYFTIRLAMKASVGWCAIFVPLEAPVSD